MDPVKALLSRYNQMSWFNKPICDGSVPNNGLDISTNSSKIGILSIALLTTFPFRPPFTILNVLKLFANALTGSIPSQVGQMVQLKALELDENGLTGPIPSQLGLLTQLTALHLANNAPSFNRTLPWEIQALIPDPLRDVRV